MQSLAKAPRLVSQRATPSLYMATKCIYFRSLSTSSPARSPVANDPWAKREAWRHHPMFGQLKQVSQMFPGLGLAMVAFGAYLAWEQVAGDKEDKHKPGHH